VKLRSCFVTAALLFAALPAVVAPDIACAGEGPHAALVVDTGEEGGEYSLCVALPEGEVSGLDLIELAGDQYDLSYRFGYGGNAVCELAGVGSDGDDCFDRYPDFWGYWHGDGSGGWTWAGSGAGSTRVEDGDVEGWSWGSGTNEGSHPPPPAATFRSVCGYVPAPPKEDGGQVGDGSAKPGPRETAEPGTKEGRSNHDRNEARSSAPQPAPTGGSQEVGGAGRDDEAPRGKAHSREARKRKADRHPVKALPDIEASPSELSANTLPASARSDEDGPPIAGLVALGMTGAFVAAAVAVRRRRAS
jgi:hypothetical protein